MSAPVRRVRIRVTGVVQGVGFRPFVYREALDLGLAGFVLNDEHGVVVEAEGDVSDVGELVRRLEAHAPPLAEVESVCARSAEVVGETGFRIEKSEIGDPPDALVSPDMATCDACLAELSDPDNRRYRYPFINCTDCGPRFSIIRGVPYDRPLTTMAGFEMCSACQAEYEDPLDRRFHAQPNACPDCGPQARLIRPDGSEVEGDGDAVALAAVLLQAGQIVAVKGIGGYHLACDAASERAVETLRARKVREDKPFALMAPDLQTTQALAELTDTELEIMCGMERPIVIARRAADAPVAGAVAPGSADIGVMLPYAPLQHILLKDFGSTLVMTSANLSDEPIAYVDEDARHRVGGIADALLVHDRPIHMRTDDSVLRSLASGSPLTLRRSRGYVPRSVALTGEVAPVLACGAELKSVFCVAKGHRAWPSHHVGDLKNWETLESFRAGVDHFERVFAVEPELIVHDLHPDYLSTRYAMERAEQEGLPLLGVQHHHAHFAACLSEHAETGRALGAIFDGTGYGPDGTVWGGEFLAGTMANADRVGMLMPVRLPGGDRAVLEPWRMAASWLTHAFDADHPPIPVALRSSVALKEWEAVCGIVQTGAASPLTTSVGRLFDAVSALCGIRGRVNYEGQAAAELEGVADQSEGGAYRVDIEGGGDAPLLIDPRAAVRELTAELESGVSPGVVSARFHNGFAEATAKACERACAELGLGTVALAGGVFQNRLLAEATSDGLGQAGLRVLTPVAMPPNDGAISYGQVAVAAARGREE